MPEGDTIFRTAATLRRALVGGRLVRFEATRLRATPSVVGAEVRSVEARALRSTACMVSAWAETV